MDSDAKPVTSRQGGVMRAKRSGDHLAQNSSAIVNLSVQIRD